jgi:hypothetical protein
MFFKVLKNVRESMNHSYCSDPKHSENCGITLNPHQKNGNKVSLTEDITINFKEKIQIIIQIGSIKYQIAILFNY